MIDLNFIRKNPKKIKQNNQLRGCTVSVDKILELDMQMRQITQQLSQMRERRNKILDLVHNKPSKNQLTEMKTLKQKIKNQESRIKKVKNQLNALLIQLPNITHKSTPAGKDETENQVIRTIGNKPKFDFKPKPHWEIGKKLDLIDESKGAKIAGSRFWYLKGEFVYLEFAIIHYALNFLKNRGFTPMLPPMIVRKRAMYGTGFFPADKNEIYQLANPAEGSKSANSTGSKFFGSIPTWDDPNQYLIGTSEVPLASYHSDEIIDVREPKKYCGFSSCFRREAGAYGKDIKGILRGHQFDKIEMFIFASKKDSWKMHEYLLSTAERFWQSLKIPYQVVLMCSGDIGAPNAKKYDIEAWMPGEEKYREVVSTSNDTDFQARRLNIKYIDIEGKKCYVHTLNSTLVAIGRTLIAIVENYQTEKGSVLIPEVLKPYMFGIEEIGVN